MNEYIPRLLSEAILRAVPYYQVITVTGPRQSGKSTMCRRLFSDYSYYNLEDIALRDRIISDPKGFLSSAGEKIIIDEVQICPDLLSYIQVIVDTDADRRFVITGSSNFALLESVSQSLAGRAAVFTLLPLSMAELGDYPAAHDINEIMFNGFYPAIFSKNIPPEMFYSNYNSTYVERDVRRIVELKNQDRFFTFMQMCALRIGTELNKADIAKTIGVSATTISEWISILKTSYILFTLSPYHANVEKRLTKTPKIYFYDTGLAAYLMGIIDPAQLDMVAVKGALFENTAIIELVKKYFNQAKAPRLYFYRESSGREVDIVDDRGVQVDIYEVKSSGTFKKNYLDNLRYLEERLADRSVTSRLIYNGESLPPAILNIRDI